MKLSKREWILALLSFAGTLLGVYSAFMLDSWKGNRQVKTQKALALRNIEGEILANKDSLQSHHEGILNLMEAIHEFQNYFDEERNFVSSSSELHQFMEQYSSYFILNDSIQVDSKRNMYSIAASIEMDWLNLSFIAWETSKSIGIVNEFGFNCIFELESLYRLQRDTMDEFDMLIEAMKENDLDLMMNALKFFVQFQEMLLEDYKDVIDKINNCA